MGKVLILFISTTATVLCSLGASVSAAMIAPGDVDICKSSQKNDYATTIITSEDPPPLRAPRKRKGGLFSRKDSSGDESGVFYTCGTPCASFNVSDELYLNASLGTTIHRPLTAPDELIFRTGKSVLVAYSDDVFLRVFNEADAGLSLIVRFGGPSLLIASRSKQTDNFELTNVWGEPATIYVYEGQSFQSMVVNSGEEIRIAAIKVADSDWLPFDSIVRDPIVAPIQIPGAKLAKYQIDRADVYKREALFHCRNYPNTMPASVFELAKRSLKEEHGNRGNPKAMGSIFIPCGCSR